MAFNFTTKKSSKEQIIEDLLPSILMYTSEYSDELPLLKSDYEILKYADNPPEVRPAISSDISNIILKVKWNDEKPIFI